MEVERTAADVTSEGLLAWAVPGALARDAWILQPPRPDERRGVMRDEAGMLLDRLLVRVARGRGALDVAVGEGLAMLAAGDRLLQLGYSGLGDYARERVGVEARTAQGMERLARELAARPVLRGAVVRGEVSARRAQAVLMVARGTDEAAWTERARVETVRALEAAARAALARDADVEGGDNRDQGSPAAGGAEITASGGGTGSWAERRASDEAGSRCVPADAEDEPWERISVPLSAEGRAKLDEAMALAGKLLGATSPRWQRLEAMCQEYLGAHPTGPGADEVDHAPAPEWLDPVKEALERETRRWEFLCAPDPVAAPAGLAAGANDPFQLDARLRELAAMRARWDELLGHLAMLVRMLGLWRDMKFASFAHFCTERLGMSARAVEQRIWLERKLWELPALRQAMRDGRLGYEQARLVAGAADVSSLEAWIERAERTTCIALRREIDATEDRQMCARGTLALRVPRRVRLLLGCAFAAAREAEKRWLDAGRCLERIAEHFVSTWGPLLEERSTPERRVLERDGGLCQVPGCSRAAVHAHHVRFRSRGGGEEPENKTALCAPHHLHGVHRGWIRVRGRAPGQLTWKLGAPAGVPPGGRPKPPQQQQRRGLDVEPRLEPDERWLPSGTLPRPA
ncbi:MAG TPA: HNH endonuclease signature motif containing protein [Anaeromyxobacteraceae bacterium]|nr:HNH endonuclease signature motif containing protein [Anaeromyxobacteraceae bacterium]